MMPTKGRSTALLAALVIGMLLVLASTLGLAVFVATAGGSVAGGGCDGDGGTGGGSQRIGERVWSAEQTANAQTITQVVVDRRLPRRAAVIAVSTAIVEADLVNVAFGDRDSLGLFQQRESQGWGPPRETLNPALATEKFLDRLVELSKWPTRPPGEAAQAVQRSAFPERYGPQEGAAAALVDRFWVGPDNPLPTPGPTDAVASAAFSTVACPDQGESDLPAGPQAPGDGEDLPPGFTLPDDPRQRAAVSFALAQLSKPYVFGAKGPDAFDCSGLVQAAWATAGVAVSAGTIDQVKDGEPVTDRKQVAPGDLLFTPGSLGTPQVPRHVGMYAGHGVVIDAHSRERGIILQQLSAWEPSIVAVRRVASRSEQSRS